MIIQHLARREDRGREAFHSSGRPAVFEAAGEVRLVGLHKGDVCFAS